MVKNANVRASWNLLKYTYGLAALAVGLDKLLPFVLGHYLLTNWAMYIHPRLLMMFSTTPEHFLYLVGIIEIVAGILIFVKTRVGAYLIAAWLVVIIINLAALGTYFDIIARDAVMAAGAVALAWLDEACGD
jgi:hypothetical protein